jgi:NAD(P)-dependent dehydrogenase (short-subunit alcohol dehydrogenase family)
MNNTPTVGASSGIGLELAPGLSNTQVVGAAARHAPDLDQATYVELDATCETLPDGAALPETIEELVFAPGRIRLQSFTWLTDEHHREDFEPKLLGAVRAEKTALPALRRYAHSSVALSSTVAVQTVMPTHTLVASAKVAVEGSTRRFAAELAPQVRVNAVAPSLTNTPLASGLLLTEGQLAPDASWVSGQMLHVDGGMSRLRRFNQPTMPS